MPPRTPYLHVPLLAVLSVGIGDASALGLGELRSRSFLGEPFVAEVEVLTTGKEVVDSGCFRLRAPQGDGELPWLQRGSFELRRGAKLLLEIRSNVPLRDPILQVGIAVACGHEVQRDYTLFLSPRGRESEAPAPAVTAPVVVPPRERDTPVPPRLRPSRPADGETPPPTPPRKTVKPARPAALPDRLVLSGIGDLVGEPSLRLATELSGWKEGGGSAAETQRELLRLEYRLLAAMNEQATSQLAATEKLRIMEATLAEMQQRVGDFSKRMDAVDTPPGAMPDNSPVAGLSQAAPASPAEPLVTAAPPAGAGTKLPAPRPTMLSEWGFYGAMLSALLGIGGWLGWRQYRERRALRAELDEPVPEPLPDPLQPAESDGLGEVDFHVGPVATATPMPVDVPLEAEAPPIVPAAHRGVDSTLSMAGATVDEHFEVNPVMELAEIMLSFGRVKGAAQALQEYIDHNPEEALQPWIRLMEVYRMAGMREEFNRLARELNQHFNVELQDWAPEQAANPIDQPLEFNLEGDGAVQSARLPAKAMTLEEMEHIRAKLIECWGSRECLDYLNRLLRDNRGGKRSGFTLPVVGEILFLIELLETRHAMEIEEGKVNA